MLAPQEGRRQHLVAQPGIADDHADCPAAAAPPAPPAISQQASARSRSCTALQEMPEQLARAAPPRADFPPGSPRTAREELVPARSFGHQSPPPRPPPAPPGRSPILRRPPRRRKQAVSQNRDALAGPTAARLPAPPRPGRGREAKRLGTTAHSNGRPARSCGQAHPSPAPTTDARRKHPRHAPRGKATLHENQLAARGAAQSWAARLADFAFSSGLLPNCPEAFAVPRQACCSIQTLPQRQTPHGSLAP
jgi:hypothetical protein